MANVPTRVVCESKITQHSQSTFALAVFQQNDFRSRVFIQDSAEQMGIKIVHVGVFTSEQIDAGMHTLTGTTTPSPTIPSPAQIPVPAAKFEDKFGLSWETALVDGVVFNAMGACKFLGVMLRALTPCGTTPTR
jgi:hypothetical protein